MKRLLSLIIITVFISSCAHVISRQSREKARTDVSFSFLQKNIDKFIGSTFIFGGVIINIQNTDEGTIIEARHSPIDFQGAIIDPDVSEGRFMAMFNGYLDPLIYKKGREITIAGELIGSREKTIGEIQYSYPLFAIREIFLWKEKKEFYAYPPPPYPYPYYWYRPPYWWYDPWWYRPYYPPVYP